MTPPRQRHRTAQQAGRPTRVREQGLIPVLAGAARTIETEVSRGRAGSVRTRFQVVALLVREERARIQTDSDATDRAAKLKRLDGIATILAKTAARDGSLLALLADDAQVSPAARELKREMERAAGMEVAEEPEPVSVSAQSAPARGVVPQSVLSRQLANPFLAPDLSLVQRRTGPSRLTGWELLGPLLRSFETPAPGAASTMPLPPPNRPLLPGGLELMPHQSQVVQAAREGHRTFLLADEPGLGKTAQALLAAEAANAYPLLVVVPNVVKANWAKEARQWTPAHPPTVVHGDGESVDGYADIVIVNYEVLDRHVGWLARHGFRGMVVDEAHFIKNRASQRSRHVLELADQLRARVGRPLMMALTGTPLINDIEDFTNIWHFLGWIDGTKPVGDLMGALQEADLTPADWGFAKAARAAVVDQGIVRRRKIDVAKDIPARRIADLPVELDGELGRNVRDAEAALARRLVRRYDAAVESRRNQGHEVAGIDLDLVRKVAERAREDTEADSSGENVFAMMRRIGTAKAELAADYAAQLVRNVGKVVFFAKHIDVMDIAEETLTRRGVRHTSIRGDQTPSARAKAIDAFLTDPDVGVIVCSLSAAGVGINLQVASNLVLAELPWTDAEQTQAVDRVHRIGQDQPVIAWRIIAAQTIDARVAELLDSKAGLAARALDGSGVDVETQSVDIQVEALVGLLTDALRARE